MIYADAFFSETVPYADLILPDTTYLERWDCISMLDRPIGGPEGPADAIRQPVLAPDRDVRPFQDVLIELGARLKLPGFVKDDGSPAYRDYPDYIANHERTPGIGPLGGWRGADGTAVGKGAANPDQLARYVENQCFWRHHLPQEQLYFKHANAAYLRDAHAMGLVPNTNQIVLQLYVEPLQRFRLAAEGHGPVQPPDDAARAGDAAISIRCRSGIRPSRTPRRNRPPGRCMRSPSVRRSCTTRGDRRTPGCGRSTTATICT